MDWADAWVAVATGAQDTVRDLGADVADVFEHGQDTIGDVADDASDTVEHGQDTIKAVASPWNLFGLGAGLGAGGIAVTGIAVVGGAAVADELLTGGAGRVALFNLFRGRRRR